jgi:hypothetical protein
MKVSPPLIRPKPAQQFTPSLKKTKTKNVIPRDNGDEIELDVPNGIIGYLTRQCGGNVHDGNVVNATSSPPFDPKAAPDGIDLLTLFAAKNAVDLGTNSVFGSTWVNLEEETIPHARNNWLCYDFKEMRIVPTHYTIRAYEGDPGSVHRKSWLVETSMDGKNWREVDHWQDNEQLNGFPFTATFELAGAEECRFIRLVNIGKNHGGNDVLWISACEIFRNLISNEGDPSFHGGESLVA